jgi:hypothetical protein
MLVPNHIFRKRHHVRTLISSFAPAVLLVGCVGVEEAPVGSTAQDLTGDNGVNLNGVNLNGVNLNGVNLNGVNLNGVNLNGVNLNGVNLNGVNLNGTSFNGVNLNGVNLNGTDFIGATFEGQLSNGDTIQLHVDDIDALAAPNDDVLAYKISIVADGGAVPLCGLDTDGTPLRALPMHGAWNTTTGAYSDTGQISLACRKAAIAKCVEFGYKPWQGYDQEHLSCVRMVRADYCGDGTTYTTNGTPINLYDHLGIQADTESWPVDGEWSPDGAVCFNHHRGSTTPHCAEKYDAACGSFSSGALLINEFDHR